MEGLDNWGTSLKGDEEEMDGKWEAVMKIKNVDLNILAESSDEHMHFKFIQQFSDSNAPSWCESKGEEESIRNTRNESNHEDEERADSPNEVDEELKMMRMLTNGWDADCKYDGS